jgi:hypothetical protein
MSPPIGWRPGRGRILALAAAGVVMATGLGADSVAAASTSVHSQPAPESALHPPASFHHGESIGSRQIVRRGDVVRAKVDGFAPRAVVELRVRDQPRPFASTLADARGVAHLAVHVPAHLAGAQVLIVSGAAPRSNADASSGAVVAAVPRVAFVAFFVRR